MFIEKSLSFTRRKDNEQRKIVEIFMNIAKRMLVITPYLLGEHQWSFLILFLFFCFSVNDIKTAESLRTFSHLRHPEKSEN